MRRLFCVLVNGSVYESGFEYLVDAMDLAKSIQKSRGAKLKIVVVAYYPGITKNLGVAV